MAYKASLIWPCDFSDFISYFFTISEHPRHLAVSHCDRNTHASGSLKWLFPPSEIFFPGLTSLGCNSYLRYSYITHSFTSFRALFMLFYEFLSAHLFKMNIPFSTSAVFSTSIPNIIFLHPIFHNIWCVCLYVNYYYLIKIIDLICIPISWI